MLIDKPIITDWTNANHNHSSAAQGGLLGTKGFMLTTAHSGGNPLRNTTEGYGGFAALAAGTSLGTTPLFVPISCVATLVIVWLVVAGTLATAGNTSVYLRVNNTTDTLITSTLNYTAVLAGVSTSINTGLSAGDFIEIKNVHPNWATEPTVCFTTTEVWCIPV